AGPSQSANSAPSGGSAAAQPQAWGDHTSAAGPSQGANSAPSGGSAAAQPQAWGDHTNAFRSVELRKPRRAERGLALIVAMLIAALAAAVAVSVATAQSQWSAQVSHRRDQVQAQSIALAGIQWARQILEADAQAGPIDDLNEPWALPLPPTPVQNGVVEGRIVDAQSLFNVNNLASATHATFERRRFARLFATLGIPETTLASMIDWVDADSVPQPDGAEDAWYLDQADASLPPNAPATRIEELGSVRGMTIPAMTSVVRFITTLPVDTPLNVNTAPAELLAASLDNVAPEQLAALVASRVERPFASLADFRARLPGGASIGDETMYSVGSRYFLVTVRARQGETVAQAHALIERANNAWPAIVWQTIE
ncbi:MAG: type II secretion system minor pseudopilin GspK, partial [Pseudomonadota bacterium]|nr:type II secretion system minor pseudopilin GspK [Pseudomonadota bacterium]